ncbi:protein-disulfide reductase DsbD family protein, partial [bacterium]|nr:protein-disulfide reductase DsbD family protein [bacterium]
MKIRASLDRCVGPARMLLIASLVLLGVVSDSKAQTEFGADLFPELSLGGVGSEQLAEEEPVTWEARYLVEADGKGRLEVVANLASTWHLYSVTQPSGGPTRTAIELISPGEISLAGDFTPVEPPKKSVSAIYNGLTVEEHEGLVVWTAPLVIPKGYTDPIEVKVNGLVCKSGGDNRCMPTSAELTALLTEESATVAVAASADQSIAAADLFEDSDVFRDEDYVVQWQGAVSPLPAMAGQTTMIHFKASPDASFHVYQSVIDDSDSATNFVVTDKAGLEVGEPVANKEAVSNALLPTLEVSYYEGEVAWSLPVLIPEGTEDGLRIVTGMIAYQACTDSSCRQPMALKFTATIGVGDVDSEETGNIRFVSAKRAEALDAAATIAWVDEVDTSTVATPTQNVEPPSPDAKTSQSSGASVAVSEQRPFLVLLGFALVGGLILNFMPCVLPVVGLKIMGFVQQAGEDRGRILILNLVYVGGIMFVFSIFAAVAAVSKFGWGEQFTYFPVRLGLTLLVFSLALSYLGVWELPTPGIAGGKGSRELQNREGLVGAFSKGVFATILSTPCSGPLLGYILGITLQLSPIQTVAIFLVVGLGMSVPYLIIGLRPSLISWLPKPGAWMGKVNELMAFLFLGTVAFFFSQFSDDDKLPLFVSLIAVWFGLWIVGQVKGYEPLKKRLVAWVAGSLVACLISVWAFQGLKVKKELDWVAYGEPALQQLQSQGQTVMVDFGAKWCATCIYNYERAINTSETREVIEELGAVAMYADWTDYNDEIKQKLEELNSRSIPLLAIYPGSRPDEPIILRDIVTQEAVLEALR